MKTSLCYLSCLLLFVACSSTRQWQGTSTSTRTLARFQELNGRQAFTLRVPANDTYLIYHFALTRGKLEASIQSPTKRLLIKEVGESETDSIHLVNQQGARYRITFKGKQASGEFDVRFTAAGK